MRFGIPGEILEITDVPNRLARVAVASVCLTVDIELPATTSAAS